MTDALTTPVASAARPTLVTGAAGFIGRHLVSRLLQEGHHVRAFVRRPPAADWAADPRVEIVHGDLADGTAVARAIAGVEAVFHLGATMRGDAAAFDDGTVAGTRHVIDSVRAHAVPRLIYISSLSVLHAPAAGAGQAITESSPLELRPDARGHYTRTKLAAERLVAEAARAHGLPAVIVRPAEVIGAGAAFLTSGVAQRVGRTLIILGDGNLPVPLVAVDDLVDALLSAARSGPFDGTVVHVVDPTVVTQNQMVTRFIQAAGGAWRVIRVPRALASAAAVAVELAFGILRRPAPLTRYRLASALAVRRFDGGNARRLWGWHPRIGVAAVLDRLAGGLAP